MVDLAFSLTSPAAPEAGRFANRAHAGPTDRNPTQPQDGLVGASDLI
jgi:hypothetical protein